MRRLILLILMLFIAAAAAAQPGRGAILIYSGTTGFRHDSIPAGIDAVTAIARQRGLSVVASEDPAVFSAVSLKRFRAVVLLSCTTDPKDPRPNGWSATAAQRFNNSSAAVAGSSRSMPPPIRITTGRGTAS
jgi:hypothetical protein